MTPEPEAVRLTRECLHCGGAEYSELELSALARAVLDLHAENERLRAKMVTMTEAFLGPDAAEHKRNLLRAVRLRTTETDQLRAGLKEALDALDEVWYSEGRCAMGRNRVDTLRKLLEVKP